MLRGGDSLLHHSVSVGQSVKLALSQRRYRARRPSVFRSHADHSVHSPMFGKGVDDDLDFDASLTFPALSNTDS